MLDHNTGHDTGHNSGLTSREHLQWRPQAKVAVLIVSIAYRPTMSSWSNRSASTQQIQMTNFFLLDMSLHSSAITVYRPPFLIPAQHHIVYTQSQCPLTYTCLFSCLSIQHFPSCPGLSRPRALWWSPLELNIHIVHATVAIHPLDTIYFHQYSTLSENCLSFVLCYPRHTALDCHSLSTWPFNRHYL